MSSIGLGLGGRSSYYRPLPLLLPETVTAANNVLLLVLDGLGHNYLLDHEGTLKIHLQGSITSVFPTSTAPAITTFLTGVAPLQHAVTGWTMHLKELGTVGMLLPFRPRWGGGLFDSAGINAGDLIAYPPIFNSLNVHCYFVIHDSLVDSAYTAAGAGRAERVGYQNLTDLVTTVVDIIGRGSERKYVYAYWPMFDTLAHSYGVGSTALQAHFYELDRGFTALLKALHGTDTLVIATADHGLIDTAAQFTIRLEDHPTLADCLSLPLCGEPRVAYCYVRPGKTAHFERYIKDHLDDCCDLYGSEDLMRMGWFGQGEPAPRLLDRIGDYVLLTKGRHVIKDRLPVEDLWSDRGVHGGTSEDEMMVPLIVAHC